MKHCLVTLAALMVAASSYAQGTLNFVNRITGTLDARVMYAGAGAIGGGTTADTQFVAQLYAGAPGGALTAVGDPIPFRNSGAGTGYWVGAARTVAGVAENGTASAQVKVWSTGLGATYEAAMASGMGGLGESSILTVTTGGGLNPPGALTGLTGFDVSPIVPEPSMAALGLLGAGLLLIRRKK
jgi:hypothetical protein